MIKSLTRFGQETFVEVQWHHHGNLDIAWRFGLPKKNALGWLNSCYKDELKKLDADSQSEHQPPPSPPPTPAGGTAPDTKKLKTLQDPVVPADLLKPENPAVIPQVAPEPAQRTVPGAGEGEADSQSEQQHPSIPTGGTAAPHVEPPTTTRPPGSYTPGSNAPIEPGGTPKSHIWAPVEVCHVAGYTPSSQLSKGVKIQVLEGHVHLEIGSRTSQKDSQIIKKVLILDHRDECNDLFKSSRYERWKFDEEKVWECEERHIKVSKQILIENIQCCTLACVKRFVIVDTKDNGTYILRFLRMKRFWNILTNGEKFGHSALFVKAINDARPERSTNVPSERHEELRKLDWEKVAKQFATKLKEAGKQDHTDCYIPTSKRAYCGSTSERSSPHYVFSRQLERGLTGSLWVKL